MNIKLNGVEKSISEDANLKVLIDEYLNGKESRGIAAAINENIIPKTKWESTFLKQDDAIEIVHAVQGG